MREILFRGKRKDNGEWAYGYLVSENIIIEEAYIDGYDEIHIGEYYKVIPKTIGQYTGIKDKDGKKIFEGDIVRLCAPDDDWIGVVKFEPRYRGGWLLVYPGNDETPFFDEAYDVEENIYLKVIGNIFDNPELLERR